MRATSSEVYRRIDNAVYNEQADIWWDENQFLHLLKSSVNPVRVGYFERLLNEVLKLDYRGTPALDVGCGGGILAEEFAGIGFRVTGIDPSEQSLATAKQHAQSMGLTIDYQPGNRRIHPVRRQHFPRCVLLRCAGARPRLAKGDRRNLPSHKTGRHISSSTRSIAPSSASWSRSRSGRNGRVRPSCRRVSTSGECLFGRKS